MKRKINLEMLTMLNISKNMIIRMDLIYSTSHLSIHNLEKGSIVRTKLNLIRKRILDGYVATCIWKTLARYSIATMPSASVLA